MTHDCPHAGHGQENAGANAGVRPAESSPEGLETSPARSRKFRSQRRGAKIWI